MQSSKKGAAPGCAKHVAKEMYGCTRHAYIAAPLWIPSDYLLKVLGYVTRCQDQNAT